MNSNTIIELKKKLGKGLDNRRLQIWNGIEQALQNDNIVRVVAFGTLVCDAEEIVLSNGHVYRPWPGRQPQAGEKISDEHLAQLWRGEYEFHADIDISDKKDMPPASLLKEVEILISSDIAAISLGASSSLKWYTAAPSSYLKDRGRHPHETKTSGVVNVEVTNHILEISKHIDLIPEKAKGTLLGSMEWYRLGGEGKSLLVSFLSYWIALEKQAFWWCRDRGLVKTEEAILKDFLCHSGVNIHEDSYTLSINARSWKKLFGRLNTLNNETNTSARAKIASAFNHVYFDKEKAVGHLDVLFSGNSSLKKLRDDIAHGNIDEITVEDRLTREGDVWKIQSVCKRFLIFSIARLAMGRKKYSKPVIQSKHEKYLEQG